jgi:nucleoside-diphosphate-sugar epimerase
MLELARLVTEIVGNDAGFKHLPLPSDDPTQRQPDIAQARAVLDWEPTMQLREGLTRTVEYFRTAAADR